MNPEDEKWLKEVFPQYSGKTIKGDIYNAYLHAERILKGKTQIQKRSCSCQYRGLADGVNKLYTKWLADNEEKLHNGL